MKQFIKYYTPLLISFISLFAKGQSSVVVEQIQAYSTVAPASNYWHIPVNTAPILEILDNGLFKKLDLVRNQSYTTEIKNLTKQSQVGKITIDWSKSRTSNFHAYVELYEMDPAFAMKNNLADIPESKKDSIVSIWFISCNIFNQKQERVFQKTILMSMLPVKTIGMGYLIDIPATTSPSMFQAIGKGLSFISPTISDMEYIEAKVPAAYTIDNLWMPFLHNQPRIIFDTSTQFISYVNAAGMHLLRTPSAIMNKMNQKDRSSNNPYLRIMPLIKKRDNYAVNEYYHIIQPLRNVNKNIDYRIEAYIEFNQFSNDLPELLSPIVFLPDAPHTIYIDNDSIGQFSVKESVVEKDKFFNPNVIFNGFDSTKKFNLGTLYEKRKIISAKVIEGNFKDRRFKILLNYANNLKTIYLDDTLILVAEGTNKPYQMVESKLPTDESVKEFLLQMAFSEIFQLPS